VYDSKLNPDLDAMHEFVGICKICYVFPYHVKHRLTVFFWRRFSYKTFS